MVGLLLGGVQIARRVAKGEAPEPILLEKLDTLSPSLSEKMARGIDVPGPAAHGEGRAELAELLNSVEENDCWP
eukprot:1903899-Pyramimonas_sp.AAC.1